MDLDGNGKIYWNEFLTATISQSIYLKEENLREAFGNFDREKKGYFEREDLQKLFEESTLVIKSSDIDNIFDNAFPSGKKQINYNDFKNFMKHLTQ